MVSRDAIKPAEVLVIQVASLPSVIAGRELGVKNRALKGIKCFHLIRAVFMAPQAIAVLAIPMIVFAWVHNCRNLAHADRASFRKRGFRNFRNVTHHKFLHYGARAPLHLIQIVTVTSFRTGLMKIVTAASVFPT
jgi:hypothetical protein